MDTLDQNRRTGTSLPSTPSSKPASTLSEKHAKAEALRVKVEYARKEAKLRKQKAALVESQKRAQAELDAEVDLLREEKEAAAAQVEATVFEQLERDKDLISVDLPYETPSERSREYVARLDDYNNVTSSANLWDDSFNETLGPLNLTVKPSSNIVSASSKTVVSPEIRSDTNIPSINQKIVEPSSGKNPRVEFTSEIQSSPTLATSQAAVNVSSSNTFNSAPSDNAARTFRPGIVTSQNNPAVTSTFCQPVPSLFPTGYPVRGDSFHRQALDQPSTDIDTLTGFLLRKDMAPKRLTRFNEKPYSFHSWKASFKCVMGELKLKASEELDLLVSYLGSESTVWAESLRSSNSSNPERGLALIWERLELVYGSYESLEACLRSRIDKFPSLGNKDYKKLFELSDLLLEIQSYKNDERFMASLAVYDSSSGVNMLVKKLPYSLQQAWISRAAKYKQDRMVIFPPFSEFVSFVQEMSKIRNNPAFQFESTDSKSGSRLNKKKDFICSKKTGVQGNDSGDNLNPKIVSERCPIHNSNHTLLDCKTFAQKSWEDRRSFLKSKGICYKCLQSTEHLSKECPKTVVCSKCNKQNHVTAMHKGFEPTASENMQTNVSSKCTTLCNQESKGRSCGKIVPVQVTYNGQTCQVYAILDDQSNRSLISPELCDKLNIHGNLAEYTLTSCSGRAVMAGRRVENLTVSSLDKGTSFKLPTLIECDNIPQNLSEIPTPDVARNFKHLRDIGPFISPLMSDCSIQLLIGRDLPAVHHVLDQVIGPKDLPFALKLPLGWVIIGEICLGKVHHPSLVNTYFTHIDKGHRGTIFPVCDAFLTIKDQDFGCEVFKRLPEDNKIGLSSDDRDFLKIMDDKFQKDKSGLWTAPLPFKSSRLPLPDNRNQAFNRAMLLKKNLAKNPKKCDHLVQFMERIFSSDAAEPVPFETNSEKEKWYLPLFGVYHPKKKDQIRGVFDSSVSFMGHCLNDVLLSGPNLTNSLLGVLLRFRKDRYAISADIEQMFYRFLVNSEHRDLLRFFWFEDNDPKLPLTTYRMKVHVFGNRPSPAVATYGLRKTVENADTDVQQFVQRDFYVDDALTSRPFREEAVSLLKRTKKALQNNGNIRLHKISSNDREIMKEFPKEELSKTLKDLDLDDSLPSQGSLGLTWDLDLDMFSFLAPVVDHAYTRRGLLSAMNSVFDPMGFIAPFTISGKILLRKACNENYSWDDPLPSAYKTEWNTWKLNLRNLDGYKIPRMYLPESLSLVKDLQIHVYSDASEDAIAAAAYAASNRTDTLQTGFIMGKAKLAPKSGHSIPRLELCAAVMATEIAAFVSDQLDIPQTNFRFFTDSKVVLGYIYNRTRRFYTYVSNRVAQILGFSEPQQWHHVTTDMNPADAATRSSFGTVHELLEKWRTGPTNLVTDNFGTAQSANYLLQHPEEDAEIRPEVKTLTTGVKDTVGSVIDSSVRFSSWKSFLTALCILTHIVRNYSRSCQTECSGWHICDKSNSITLRTEVEHFILLETQKRAFSEELHALQKGKIISKNSSIISLAPYLDCKGLIRVGGRLSRIKKNVGIASTNPIIVPKGHIATLLARHYHQQTFHQGRHFTEGAIRAHGLWIIGAKKLVASIIYKCVICRKLRGPLLEQKMADLPDDRISPGPPFTSVGVDVFGPWEIATRRTRGGVAHGKRWAVIFTCLTTRSTHIEVLEDMSSSCFINSLRRFIALRGPVKILRSDRGSNFVGAADCIGAHVINVEDRAFKKQLTENGVAWYFNVPHASHMGGVWERSIGIARRILDSMFLNSRQKQLTHEILCTFMAEVTAIMNSRPIVAIDTDSRDPLVLSPNILLTQKQGEVPTISNKFGLKDCYKAQWKHVQWLSDTFWKRWREQYLNQLQHRHKWQSSCPNLKKGDVVLLREKDVHRNFWPMALVEETFISEDKLVREVLVRCLKDQQSVTYTRPICELVLLVSE